MKRRRGLDFENRDRLSRIGAFAMLQRLAQFVVLHESSATAATEPIAFVDPHQIRRRIDVNAMARGFQDRAQIGDCGTLAVGPGDVNHRGQLSLWMAETFQEPLHALQVEIDALWMQGGKPRHQIAEWARPSRRRVHAGGAVGASSAAEATGAAVAACAAGFAAVGIAGDLVSKRQSRASVGRKSWRCTTRSTMPWSLRYSARWNPSGSFSRMVCSITRAPAKPISAPGSAICTSPSIA